MKPEKINIAIVGFGNIGSYFYKILEKNKKKIFTKTGKVPFVRYISAKNINKKRLIKIPKSKWIKKPLNIPLMSNVDIIFELIGGAEGAAKRLVFSALKNKIHVITANKALMAKYGDQLAYLAEKNGVNLEYDASVAGGVPIIRSIKDGLIANKINKIYGILNGTTNFILSSMQIDKKKFSEVLDRAKKLGFAENNPISDLNGNDSAAKLRILSSIAFNKTISKNKKLIERVHPCLILKHSHLANIDGVLNAVVIDGLPIGRSVLQGEGAGPGPTSSALLSDLYSVLKGNIQYPFGIPYALRKKISNFDISKHLCSSYLRIEVKDLPGVLSSITKTFANNNISIKNLIQNPYKKNKKASIIIITHENLEKNYKNLLTSLNKNKFVLRKPTFIRIEKI